MDLQQLETFLVVVERRSFTAAAEELYVSQAAVSSRVKALEAQLGARLFERSPHRVELTDVGAQLVGYAREIVAIAGDAMTTLGSRQIIPLVRFGASPSSAAHIVPTLIGAFRQRNPHIAVLLEVEAVPRLLKRLAQNELDVAIVEPCRQHRTSLLEAIGPDRLVVVAGPGSPFASIRGPLTLHELADLPLVMRTRQCCTLHFLAELLSDAAGKGAVKPNVVMWVNELESLKRLVRTGVGVTVISQTAVVEELRSGQLVALPVEGVCLVRQRYVGVAPAAASDPAVQSLVSYLESDEAAAAITDCEIELGLLSASL